MKNSILRKAKLRLTLLAAIPLLMGLTSCQQEEDFAPLGGEAQEICVATRATTYDNNDDGFTEGQVMTVAIESRTNGVWKSDFFKYTYQGGEWISDNPMKVRDFNAIEGVYTYIGFSNVENDLERYKYLSYEAYLTDIDNRICDQSDDLLSYDWMIPTAEVALPTAENPVINAHFVHGLAKVTIGNIVYASEYEERPELTDVRFKSFDSSCYNDMYDIVENEFIAHSFFYGIIDVIPFEDKINGTYTAFLVTNRELNLQDEVITPTEWTFLTLKVNGEEKIVKLVDDPTTDKNEALLEAGKHYTFDLKVGKDKVTLIPTTTDTDFPGGWSNDSEVDLN